MGDNARPPLIRPPVQIEVVQQEVKRTPSPKRPALFAPLLTKPEEDTLPKGDMLLPGRIEKKKEKEEPKLGLDPDQIVQVLHQSHAAKVVPKETPVPEKKEESSSSSDSDSDSDSSPSSPGIVAKHKFFG